MMMKKCEVWKAVLFTASHRAVPVHSLHPYCEHECTYINNKFGSDVFLLSDCNINYHHNYWVFRGQQFYYDSLPDIIQVSKHRFAERKLINLWIPMMLLSWTSVTNCACIYNMSMTDDTVPNWQFNLSVTSDQVYDGFTILSLLEDCLTQQKTLLVPHGGELQDGFTEAVHVRHNWL